MRILFVKIRIWGEHAGNQKYTDAPSAAFLTGQSRSFKKSCSRFSVLAQTAKLFRSNISFTLKNLSAGLKYSLQGKTRCHSWHSWRTYQSSLICSEHANSLNHGKIKILHNKFTRPRLLTSLTNLIQGETKWSYQHLLSLNAQLRKGRRNLPFPTPFPGFN